MIIGVVMLAAVAVYFFWQKDKADQKFRTEKITRGDITEAVTATGTVNAVTTVLVGTQVSGTVRKIHADFNSPVRKGQLIAEIDPATFEAQVDQARANVLNARANLAKAEVTQNDADRTLKRSRDLFARGYIAKSDLDAAETNFETSRAAAASAKAQVSQTEAALRIAETNMRYTKIVSPVDGVVISRNVDAGQTVAASFQTPTLFTIAQDLTKMQIDSNVAEADIGKVLVGQDVEFSVDAYSDSPFRGRVSEIRNAPINVQNVVTYDVVVKVDNPEKKLKPGMTANVSIVVQSRKDVLRVPNAALRFRLAEKGGTKDRKDKGQKDRVQKEKGPGVWVLENRQPRRVSIKTGISDGAFAEVVSGGLEEGKEVIIEALGKANNQGQSQSGPPRMRF